jgi:hypothetical protein
MENETVPAPELYTSVPGDMDGAPTPELINAMPPVAEDTLAPELYMDDIDMDAMQDYMETQGMPMNDYYDSTYPTTTTDGAGLALLATTTFMIMTLLAFGILVLMIVSLWKIFTKAGREGWKSIIPFYNTWVLLEIAGKPGWWLFLMFIPFVNIIIMVIMYFHLSKAFGKGLGYTIGMIFLAPIFFPMLAFGNAKYTKPIDATESNTPDNSMPQQNS